MAYRLTEQTAAAIVKLIKALGRLDPSLRDDRTQQIVFKRSGEINYEGLQKWLRGQKVGYRFDPEILRCQLNPTRRMEKKGVEDCEYLESLIEAVNALYFDCCQKYSGEIERKLHELGLGEIEFIQESYEEVMSAPLENRAGRPENDRRRNAAPAKDVFETSQTIEVTPMPLNADSKITKPTSSITRNPMLLDHQMLAKLRKDLMNTCPEEDFPILLESIGEDPARLYARYEKYEKQVFDTVRKLNGWGNILALVRGAVQKHPDSPYLQGWREWLDSGIL